MSDELDISTSAASVDMEADRISSRMITDSDSGITLAKSSGIRRSYIGTPALNTCANSGSPGDKKILVVEPM